MYRPDVYITLRRDMVRIQIYLTEHQRDELAVIAGNTSKRQSELIREAVDRFIERTGHHRRERLLEEPAGVWKGRSDLPDYETVRAEWDRD